SDPTAKHPAEWREREGHRSNRRALAPIRRHPESGCNKLPPSTPAPAAGPDKARWARRPDRAAGARKSGAAGYSSAAGRKADTGPPDNPVADIAEPAGTAPGDSFAAVADNFVAADKVVAADRVAAAGSER